MPWITDGLVARHGALLTAVPEGLPALGAGEKPSPWKEAQRWRGTDSQAEQAVTQLSLKLFPLTIFGPWK